MLLIPGFGPHNIQVMTEVPTLQPPCSEGPPQETLGAELFAAIANSGQMFRMCVRLT